MHEHTSKGEIHQDSSRRSDLVPKLKVTIGLIICKDCPELITALRGIQGEPEKTRACKIKFGWTLCGGRADSKSMTRYKTDRQLFPLVEQDFQEVGGKPFSQQDLQFLKILNAGIKPAHKGSCVMPLPMMHLCLIINIKQNKDWVYSANESRKTQTVIRKTENSWKTWFPRDMQMKWWKGIGE